MKRFLWLVVSTAQLLAVPHHAGSYTWENYEELIYASYVTPGKLPAESQVEILEKGLSAVPCCNKRMPPGWHAHLGYLYYQLGKPDEAPSRNCRPRRRSSRSPEPSWIACWRICRSHERPLACTWGTVRRRIVGARRLPDDHAVRLPPTFRAHPPRSILILPPLNESTALEGTYGYLSTVTQPVAEHGYYVFPVEVVDRFLKENGMPTAGEMHQVPLNRVRKSPVQTPCCSSRSNSTAASITC